jgi:hypothetical protein
MSARRDTVTVEAGIVSTIAHWLDLLGAALTSDGGRRVMTNEFLRQLQATDAATLPTDLIIEAAEAGNAAADAALRVYIADRVNHSRELTAQLAAFNVKALLRPPVNYPRGGSDTVDSWTRDIAICVLIDVTAQRWQLDKTRNRTTTKPSAAHFVSLALRRRGSKLKESWLNRVYWGRKKLADRIAASLFPSTF